MADEEHFLASGKAGAGYGLGGLFGIGIALMFVPKLPFWIGCAVALAGAIGTAWVGFKDIKKRTSIGILLASMTIVEISVTLFLIVQASAPTIYSYFHSSHKKQSEIGNPLDDQISVSCETSERPKNYRSDGDLHTYELGTPPTYWGVPFPAAGADTWLPSGEGPINWAGMRPASFSKCTISNYSNSAILNAVVVIPAWYSLPIKTKNGFTTGSFITGRFVISPFLNLDPVTSPNNTSYFYIENDTKYFVQFPAPTVIQISWAGSNERQTVKLIPPSMPIMGLWPVNPSKNPPN